MKDTQREVREKEILRKIIADGRKWREETTKKYYEGLLNWLSKRSKDERY